MNQELGEIGGVFVSKQPSDTDMGAKEPKTDGWVVGWKDVKLVTELLGLPGTLNNHL